VIKREVEETWGGGLGIRNENTEECSKWMKDISPQTHETAHTLSKVNIEEITISCAKIQR
jgi:hypothetical protein